MENLKKENIENVEQDNSSKEEDNAVHFSLRLVAALEDKFKNHNKENPSNRSTLQQLKKVYIQGAKQFEAAKDPMGSLNLWGLARVNMYLAYKSGRKISIESEQPTSGKMDGLDFELQEKTSISNFLDLTEEWFPTEQDYKMAEEDVSKYNLNYSFSSLDEIYLEYKKVSFEWE